MTLIDIPYIKIRHKLT